ncbi:hypothetical protein OR573_11955 [Halomonas sp. CH40]
MSQLKSKKKKVGSYDVIVHIGAPKTGSSAIQRFCVENRSYLKTLGFYYPEHPLDKNGVSGGHTEIAGALINNDKSTAGQRFHRYLGKAKKNDMTLLLSAEAFYGQHESMAELCQGLSVKVIGFLRHPVDYLLGNHNQGIKRHMVTHRLNQAVAEMVSKPTPHLVGKPFIHWANQFGDDNCYFAAYQAPGSGLPLETVFLKALGTSEQEAKNKVTNVLVTNRSYVKSALEFKRLLNTVLSELPVSHANKVDWCLQGYSDRAVDEYPYQHSDVPETLMLKLSSHLSEQMKEVSLRFPQLSEVATLNQKALHLGKLENGFGLQGPLAALAEELPDTLRLVSTEALRQHTQGRRDYVFLKLMDVLGLDFDEVDIPISVFDNDILQRLKRPKNSGPDYLREMSLVLERLGYLNESVVLIDMALGIRPTGKGLIQIKKRLDAKLLNEKKMQ